MQPKTHKAAFLMAGLCSYESEGNGIWLFKSPAIDASISSFIGKPVQITHNDGSPAVGYVSNVYFDNVEKFYVADFFLLDEQAEAMVCSGDYFPSCFYVVEELGGGGVEQSIEYQCEILKARFDHLAIVDSPRYSCGVFDFNNPNTANEPNKPKFELKAINSGGMMAKKKTAKNESGTEEEKKEGEAAPAAEPLIEADTTAQNSTEPTSVTDKVVIVNGKEVPITELMEKYKEIVAKNNERIIDENESVDVDGESVKIKDMIEAVYGKAEEPAPAEEPAEPPPAENEGEEDEEEEDPPPPAAQNAKPKSAVNGVQQMKKAATAANSAPANFNGRLPNESRDAYNKRMTEKIF